MSAFTAHVGWAAPADGSTSWAPVSIIELTYSGAVLTPVDVVPAGAVVAWLHVSDGVTDAVLAAQSAPAVRGSRMDIAFAPLDRVAHESLSALLPHV